MNKTLQSTTKIRFQDCDPFNHLNNAKYIDYLINAREDQIEEFYDLDIYRHIQTNGAGWVIGSHQITYLKPAVLMEEVLIESQLFSYNENELKVEMKMWDKNKKKLKALLWTNFVYVDLRDQKKTSHPEDLMQLFKEVNNPVDQTIFRDRCGYLINLSKQPLAEN